MTLDEAIKNLEFHIREGEVGHHKDDIISVKLGIEALKQIKRYRKSSGIPYTGNLPGETEE